MLAVFFEPLAVLMQFDQPLAAVEADGPGPWLVRHNGTNYQVLHRSVGELQTVLATLAEAGPALPGNVVEYNPPPDDVVSLTGLPALPFTAPLLVP